MRAAQRKRAKRYALVCNTGGCVFLRQNLAKRDAERQATAHMGHGHSVSMVAESSP